MKKYNYLEAMKSDILDYIKEEIDFTEFETLEELEEMKQKFDRVHAKNN